MTWKQILFLIFLIGLFDFIWISLNKRMYSNMFSRIQKSTMLIKPLQAILAYVFIILLFIFIIIPIISATDGSFFECMKKAGFLGICVYGIYNFTNFAIFDNYSWKVAVVDTIWGGTLFTLVSYFMGIFLQKEILY